MKQCPHCLGSGHLQPTEGWNDVDNFERATRLKRKRRESRIGIPELAVAMSVEPVEIKWIESGCRPIHSHLRADYNAAIKKALSTRQ